MDQVRGKLALRGWRSLSAWALAHGYLPVTARRAVYDWGMRDDHEPLGGIKRAIMRDLRRTLEADVELEAVR
ncbi:MAG: hypothetical protein COS39_06600 [Hydrogenophilales bacterium CG03_land_8_20_14_0_80_62_28]|nr:MAG: hypothetical protein AUJ86_04300 [Hydrogenophilaceae bacterium CG1_02_62_390]PIV22719.1 MAG: hypothetical protein COS39_06600 [Hydrogenophilales bacterium CG03_land_8_20_14_0_80_62_28]PIW39096.1 MAG: hypothetical protein COW23_03200 [Hydrogenophilales bacterium CG15_BIG_FIL_POST_REV_8_21_14_020_62_31]PIW72851.1 MAG: hypothetical protein COW07_00675 [Hydrogenophilales bacterium CG12_big_fil_rev_8_21_14_0_65_61_21]PIX01367.1 MAG: hypothetical protein COZ79_07330 [Hydrogenophilales bacteri